MKYKFLFIVGVLFIVSMACNLPSLSASTPVANTSEPPTAIHKICNSVFISIPECSSLSFRAYRPETFKDAAFLRATEDIKIDNQLKCN